MGVVGGIETGGMILFMGGIYNIHLTNFQLLSRAPLPN